MRRFEEFLNGGIPLTIEDLGDVAALAEELNLRIIKRANYSAPWDQIANRPGHSEPVGNGFVQRLVWLYYRVLFAAYRALENRLNQSRHFSGPSGYDWEDAEFQKFKQRTRWIDG